MASSGILSRATRGLVVKAKFRTQSRGFASLAPQVSISPLNPVSLMFICSAYSVAYCDTRELHSTMLAKYVDWKRSNMAHSDHLHSPKNYCIAICDETR
jgi:hypothetical protein